MIDVLEVDHALDAATLDRLRREMRAATGEPATVLGQSAQGRVISPARKAAHVAVDEAGRTAVTTALERLQPRIAAHFDRRLSGFEAPQFLRYGPGDYFVAHQDGNTPLIHDESRFRRVSVVIFLSAPESFDGGSLVLHGGFAEDEPPRTLAPAAGTAVAFPSETTHEVLPVTRGERLSVVSWYRG